jgi:uncharacterized membrane protein YidH (DUF202 family)
MIKGILLIFDPGNEMDKVVARGESGWFVLFMRFLPVVLLVSVVQSLAMVHWGKYQSAIRGIKHFTPTEGVAYGIFEVMVSILVVLISAFFLQSGMKAFGKEATFERALVTMGYGLLPLVCVKILNVIPWMTPWIPWAMGVYFAWRVLYRAVPRVMKPEHAYALGVFIMAATIATLCTGAACMTRFLAMEGKFAWWDSIVAFVGNLLKISG